MVAESLHNDGLSSGPPRFFAFIQLESGTVVAGTCTRGPVPIDRRSQDVAAPRRPRSREHQRLRDRSRRCAAGRDLGRPGPFGRRRPHLGADRRRPGVRGASERNRPAGWCHGLPPAGASRWSGAGRHRRRRCSGERRRRVEADRSRRRDRLQPGRDTRRHRAGGNSRRQRLPLRRRRPQLDSVRRRARRRRIRPLPPRGRGRLGAGRYRRRGGPLDRRWPQLGPLGPAARTEPHLLARPRWPTVASWPGATPTCGWATESGGP